MNNNEMTVKDEEFKTLVYDEVQKMRRMLFDLRCEDYIFMPTVKNMRRKGREFIEMPLEEWERYNNEISEALGDLLTARDMIESMKPVFDEYHSEYEEKHNISFDEYMKIAVSAYDVEEFERVRERFEEERYKPFDVPEER